MGPWILLIVIIAIIALFWGCHHLEKRWADTAAQTDQPRELVVWVLEACNTFGLDESSTYVWERFFKPAIEYQYDNVLPFINNTSLPSLNTSEGLLLAKKYLQKMSEKNDDVLNPNFRKPKPDIAVINFGVDNLWNLHAASFLTDGRAAADDPVLSKIRARMNAPTNEALSSIARRKYYDEFQGDAWTLYFENFEVPLLRDWITSDLSALVKLMRDNGIEPVLFTGGSDVFAGFNDLIRQIGRSTNTPVIDVEHPIVFYADKGYARTGSDVYGFRLNEEGHKYLGDLAAEKFIELYGQAAVDKILDAKKPES